MSHEFVAGDVVIELFWGPGGGLRFFESSSLRESRAGWLVFCWALERPGWGVVPHDCG